MEQVLMIPEMFWSFC